MIFTCLWIISNVINSNAVLPLPNINRTYHWDFGSSYQVYVTPAKPILANCEISITNKLSRTLQTDWHVYHKTIEILSKTNISYRYYINISG